jgi:general secretion pathway protein N
MKALVPLSLAVSFLVAGPATAQVSTGFGLEGVVGRPEVAALPRRDPSLAAPSVVEGPASERRPARANPLWSISLDSLRATRERPVFSETRRPAVIAVAEPVRVAEPAPEPEPEVPEPPALTLIGTVVGQDADVAVFLDAVGHQVVRLRVGEAGSGWTLRRVEPKTTTLEKDRREVTLSLPTPEASSGSDGGTPGGVDAFTQPPLGTSPGTFGAGGGQNPSGPPLPSTSRYPTPGLPRGAQVGHEF